MQLARRLVSGVDIWLNTPTRPLEASGTSGEKALMNGVVNFSVLDGWWLEGYREGAGWALTEKRTYQNQEQDVYKRQGYITEGQLFLRRDSDIGKVIVDPFRSLSRLKQLVTGKKTRKDHPQVMNAAVRPVSYTHLDVYKRQV